MLHKHKQADTLESFLLIKQFVCLSVCLSHFHMLADSTLILGNTRSFLFYTIKFFFQL